MDGIVDIREELRSPARRKRIESQLAPMSMNDMDDNFEIRQMIPTGPFSFLFRSPSHGEIELVQRIVVMENVGGLYSSTKLNSMITCLALLRVNNKALPDHRDAQGNYTEKSLKTKYEEFLRINYKVIEDARVQFAWFDERHSKFIAGGEMGNG